MLSMSSRLQVLFPVYPFLYDYPRGGPPIINYYNRSMPALDQSWPPNQPVACLDAINLVLLASYMIQMSLIF